MQQSLRLTLRLALSLAPCLGLVTACSGDDDDPAVADAGAGSPDAPEQPTTIDAAPGAADAEPGAPDASDPPPSPDAAPGGAADAGPVGTPDAAPTPDAASTPDAAPMPPDAGDVAMGCPGTELLAVPEDPAARGPWSVGARTVTIGRLTVEVWYPAEPGSAAGEQAIRYDVRQQLPASQQDKIPDADNPWQDCDCYRDLPLDTARGPYPVVLFIHGTAAFRTQSLQQMTHWASRGFVVLSADHPGLKLADSLAILCPDTASGRQNLVGDAEAMFAELTAGDGALAFLSGHVDLERTGVVGHSAGGNAVARLTDLPGVRISVPMAANTAPAVSATLESSLLLGALADSVVAYRGTQSAYASAPEPKRLVGIDNTGHLAFSGLCELENAAGDDLITVAQAYDVCGVFLAGFLFDCEPTYTPGEVVSEIVDYATAAALEEVLHCRTDTDPFSALEATYPEVAEYQSAP